MLKQIRTVKYPKIILHKSFFKDSIIKQDPLGRTNFSMHFENSTIIGKENTQGSVNIIVHDIELTQLNITYFTDTTPPQKVSFSQLKKDLEQLDVEVIQEYYNHYEVFIRAQSLRASKALYINICIPHSGDVEYIYTDSNN